MTSAWCGVAEQLALGASEQVIDLKDCCLLQDCVVFFLECVNNLLATLGGACYVYAGVGVW